jgi:hypothetical protein
MARPEASEREREREEMKISKSTEASFMTKRKIINEIDEMAPKCRLNRTGIV